MIKKGTWVEIEEIVLTPEDRAKNIPEETKKIYIEPVRKTAILVRRA